MIDQGNAMHPKTRGSGRVMVTAGGTAKGQQLLKAFFEQWP